ncbi:hypothetical protein M2375_002567 [Comamonas sp. BIGb0152]|uniref:hypothetical protein n=1 Tax=Comamonas sp. BIGb0152 TaxID=2940601 RepID=UPI00216871E2|nr:hypothetical protein [Comamonas sp. BIGb0152]MCS4294334.1 hypothetical protein [Comamonas sp. BIGb0152]
MTDIDSINLDKLRNIVQKFIHRDFTAAQIADDYWDGATEQIGASGAQFEAVLQRNAALLGIQAVGSDQPARWHVAA